MVLKNDLLTPEQPDQGVKFLNWLIEKKSLKVSLIAEYLGVTRQSVWKWRKNGFPLEFALRLGRALKLKDQVVLKFYGFPDAP